MKLSLLAASLLSIEAVYAAAIDNIEKRSQTDELAHGNYGRFENTIYRYHQVGDNLFAGVKPEEWNDDVHVPHSTHKSRSQEYESLPRMEDIDVGNLTITERDLTSQCTYRLNCAGRRAAEFGTSCAINGMWFMGKVLEFGNKVLDKLNQPLWANAVGVGTQNLVVTGIFTAVNSPSGTPPPPPETCDSEKSQADMMRQMVINACAVNPDAMGFNYEVTLPDGSFYSFRMAAAPASNLSNSAVCNAPDPANGPKQRAIE